MVLYELESGPAWVERDQLAVTAAARALQWTLFPDRLPEGEEERLLCHAAV